MALSGGLETRAVAEAPGDGSVAEPSRDDAAATPNDEPLDVRVLGLDPMLAEKLLLGLGTIATALAAWFGRRKIPYVRRFTRPRVPPIPEDPD